MHTTKTRTLPRATTPLALLATLAVAPVMGCASTPTDETAMTTATATAPAFDPATAFDPAEHLQPATAVLLRYADALNGADVEAILSLYAADAVFMAQHRSPAIGHDQIAAAYREIFTAIRLDITFEVDEVVVVSPTVAYARTRSAGTTTVLGSGAQLSEGNQELFVLVRADASGDWRIGRYIFSTTQAPAGGS